MPWTGMDERIAAIEAARREVDEAVDDVLTDASNAIEVVLRTATPADTGEAQDGWTTTHGTLLHVVDNAVGHVPFIPIDDSPALQIMTETNSEIERRVDAVLDATAR